MRLTLEVDHNLKQIYLWIANLESDQITNIR